MKNSRDLIPTQGEGRVDLDRPLDGATLAPGYGYREVWEGESSQISEYWRAVRKRLWLVLGIAVLITSLAAIYMARRPNIYEASSAVQVDLEQVNRELVTSDRRLGAANPDPAYFNTQLQLLTSDNLLRRVIRELSLDTNPEILKAKNESGASTIGRILQGLGLAGDKSKSGNTDEELSGALSASGEEMAEAIRLAPYVEILRRGLSVDPVRESRATVKDTRLIEITYRSNDPVLSALVANGIAEVFTRQNQEKRSGTNKKTNDFLQERVASLQSQIKEDELKLAELKRSSGIINLDSDQTLVINTLSGLNKQLLEAENLRKIAEAEYNAVKDDPVRLRSRAEAENIRYVTEREIAIQSLKNKTSEQVTQLQAEKDKLLLEFKPTALEVVEIDRKIAALNKGVQDAVDRNNRELSEFRKRSSDTILENLKVKYLQAKSTEDKIRVDFDRQYNQAQGQNNAGINIRLLEGNLTTNKAFLENLTKQQSENDVVAQGSENNISVAKIGVPPRVAVGPRRLMSVFAAFVFAVLLGAGLALVLEYLDDSIKTPEEAERFLRLPALATIPSLDSPSRRKLLLVGGAGISDEETGSNLLIHSDPRSSTSEAYRQLRTSILLSSAGHAPKSLLITSSLPSEGKTTTAVNTAISLAQTGANVLIVDADMRRPRVHSVLNASNREGLSTLLSSEPDENVLGQLIQTSEVANLYVLASGPVPPNPAELIGSEQMGMLLKSLTGRFTHVVIDSPPIASFTDGVLLASMVDGVILVVNSGKSSRQIIRRGRQYLQDVGAKIFGIVLNNVNSRDHHGSYYYQDYYSQSSESDDDARP